MKNILQCLIALCLIHSLTTYADNDNVTKSEFKEKMNQFFAEHPLTEDPTMGKQISPCMVNEYADKVYTNGENSINGNTAAERLIRIKNNQELASLILLKCMASTGVIDTAIANADNSTKPAEPLVLSVNDVLLDFDSMVGKKLRIKGVVISAGNTNLIFHEKESLANLLVDNSKLSRDDRKKLLSDCTQGCNMMMDGVVGNVMYNKGFIASKLWY